MPAKFFARYFARAFEWLRPGGQFLHHAIVHAPNIAERPGHLFMKRYVFPEHCLASIGRTVATGEGAGFEVRDVESLREHYNLTLRHWLRRLEAAQSAVERQSDPLSFRVFRLYLAGSAYEFDSGRLNIYQSLLIKPNQGQSGLPLTRADWYGRAVARDVNDRAAKREEISSGFDQGEAKKHHDRADGGVHL